MGNPSFMGELYKADPGAYADYMAHDFLKRGIGKPVVKLAPQVVTTQSRDEAVAKAIASGALKCQTRPT